MFYCAGVATWHNIQQNVAEAENMETKDVGRDDTKIVDRKQVCERVAEVVREAIAKIEGVAEEKAAFVKKARSALEASERELKDKKQELTDLQVCIKCRSFHLLGSSSWERRSK
jgi:hypothetical protein